MTTAENMKLVGEDQRNFIAFFNEALKAWGQGRKHDPVGSPSQLYYTNGGALTYPFSRPDVFSALMQPASFISSLPLLQSRAQNEVATIMTGQTASTGSNPDDVCGEPPQPGNLKFCRVNNVFGKFFVGSKVVDTDEFDLIDNVNVQPIQIQNFAGSDNALVPDPLRMPNVNFASEDALKLYEVATMLQRIMAVVEIDGDSSLAPNASADGWITEYDGLSRKITDGIIDIGGQPCPAADSLVESWNAAVDATVNGLTLPQLLHDIYFSRQQLARKVGMQGVVWDWVMDERLFRQVAFIFACTYAYARCGSATTALPIQREMAILEQRFNEMINGQFLLIAGAPVPVQFTSGAEVDDSVTPITGGRIFLKPRVWNGRPLTYLQFSPKTQAGTDWDARSNTTRRFISNGGLYRFATRSNGFCDQLLAKGHMRLMVDARFLGARVDGITFNSYVGYRSYNPDSSSFYDGGTTFYTNNFAPPEA
jgi:hypothetical protein